jgi:roadblock/LC7 domain-containing protein
VISGERFRLGFRSAPEQHDEGMPNKVANDEERKLYLTPGGKYTEADIKANGNVTASMKFKGLKSSHDMFPKAGDKICPVTKTKANPQFTWVVDGKPYEFCCPPCVDEFVKTAKATPDEILKPVDYVKSK